MWGKAVVLSASWIVSCILLYVSADNGPSTVCNDVECHALESGLPRNQTGAVRYTRWDPKEAYRPVFSAGFENLLADNNRLGIFKTALHKEVRIQNFQVRLHNYGFGRDAAGSNLHPGRSYANGMEDVFPVISGAAIDGKTLLKMVGALMGPGDGLRIRIDLSNVTEVLVAGFSWEVFLNGELLLGIQSKRALASCEQAGILLRGHVTITSADGGSLECNCAKWDIEKERFTVDGVYVLRREGMTTAGKDICVDSQLNVFGAKQAEFKRKEVRKCYAKLPY
jgi:hypothetical protein